MFAFVPRKVAQKSKPHHTATGNAVAPAATHPEVRAGPSKATPIQNSASTTKGKQKHSEPAIPDEDLIALLSLSLSDHSLWANVELRRALATADEGWLPLSALLRNSAYFSHLSSRPPESAYVKAIRTHAADIFEVRMRVTAPSRTDWQGTDASTSSDPGGYEVRRRDWRDALLSARNTTRQEWEKSTVYMECLPLAHRSVPKIYAFISALLGLPSSGQVLSTGVQSITLPVHHLDRPGDVPKPKGFALVTFASEDDASRLVADWPWRPRRNDIPPCEDENEETGAPAREAVKFGFRALPKARWDALKEEYLAHRQRLLDQIAQSEPEPEAGPADPSYDADGYRDRDQGWGNGEPPTHAPPAPAPAHEHADPDAPFPPGCLVYVRGVHPETNRTTLKALFAARGFGPDALDYVDYSKGMGTCHLRLSAPHHAQALVTAFHTLPLVQRQGLDSTGTEGDAEGGEIKPISMEVVEGAREELYWSKVPEKIRREAVRRAIAQASSAGGKGGDAKEHVDAVQEEDTGEQEGKRKRKRRRKA
ncbi:uncharacterized protein TRAVEDRAFT_44663 [Trametes versicolor FP-101664 SS1]|uniref:uncharacterized protein n=1 Tax=Trametes versicolor (strain FP-101664) TaxID=717944 RepID=UPI0004622C1B|nr:uncharacterized protein TRAVEDRAFT_44663 [Trametes versicolor FP-101664 SS1]EIW61842.1 hypothetical protein TRAVEDRAFT_44663 [Trametes versicolor FP-101664 SS1]